MPLEGDVMICNEVREAVIGQDIVYISRQWIQFTEVTCY